MADYRRGDVIDVRLEPVEGSEMKGMARPCLIVQNDTGNQFAQVTIVVPFTDRQNIKRWSPVFVEVRAQEGGLDFDSVAHCGQVRAVDQHRIVGRRGSVSAQTMASINEALKISLALD